MEHTGKSHCFQNFNPAPENCPYCAIEHFKKYLRHDGNCMIFGGSTNKKGAPGRYVRDDENCTCGLLDLKKRWHEAVGLGNAIIPCSDFINQQLEQQDNQESQITTLKEQAAIDKDFIEQYQRQVKELEQDKLQLGGLLAQSTQAAAHKVIEGLNQTIKELREGFRGITDLEGTEGMDDHKAIEIALNIANNLLAKTGGEDVNNSKS